MATMGRRRGWFVGFVLREGSSVMRVSRSSGFAKVCPFANFARIAKIAALAPSVPFLGLLVASLVTPSPARAEQMGDTGIAYDDRCLHDDQVPLPPPWGVRPPGTPQPWKFNGYLETDHAGHGPLDISQAMFSPDDRGFIYYYISTSPPGLCMTVPRVKLDDSGNPIGGSGSVDNLP